MGGDGTDSALYEWLRVVKLTYVSGRSFLVRFWLEPQVRDRRISSAIAAAIVFNEEGLWVTPS